MMKQLIGLSAIYLTANIGICQQFQEENLVDTVRAVYIEYGDFDRDGDLDILLFNEGNGFDEEAFTQVWENTGSGFVPLDIDLPASFSSFGNESTQWVDYNQDGWLDIFILLGGTRPSAQIYRNNGDKTFSEIPVILPNLTEIFVAARGPFWADFDNDGDLDLTFTGVPFFSTNNVVRIYENDLENGHFLIHTDIFNSLIKSEDPWADFNNDGYLDLATFEPVGSSEGKLAIHKNNGDQTFTKIIFPDFVGLNDFPPGSNGEMTWGDYNSDGFLDIIMTGQHSNTNALGTTRIYQNTGDEGFTEINLEDVFIVTKSTSLDWGDFDQDGDLDILQNSPGAGVKLILNNNGSFERSGIEFISRRDGTDITSPADLNGDMSLDFIVSGHRRTNFDPYIVLFENNSSIRNSQPEPPQNLVATYRDQELTLSWSSGSDAETPSLGLSYNVYVINDNDTIVYPYSLSDGRRLLPNRGNAESGLIYKLQNVPEGNYRWGVQAIDNSYIGSAFSAEMSYEATEIVLTSKSLVKSPRVFPNPFQSKIQIELAVAVGQKGNIVLTDLSGQVLLENNNVEFPYQIDTNTLQNGIYILTVESGSEVSVGKIVKN